MLLLLAYVVLNAPKAEPPPEEQQPVVARPPVPVPQPLFRSSRGRERGIGFTAAFGVTGTDANGKLAYGGFAGPRMWMSENVIGSLVLAPQQAQDVTDVGLVARFEVATATKEDVAFPSSSIYVGAGPEVSTALGQSHAGVRAVLGLHLPTGWPMLTALNPREPASAALFWALFILPTTLEVQLHAAPGMAGRWSFLAGIGF